MGEIGNDMESQMIEALTRVKTEEPTKSVSLTTKINCIMDNRSNLSIDNKVDIGLIILNEGSEKYIKDCSDGILINLDTLPTSLINTIYNYYKKNKLCN